MARKIIAAMQVSVDGFTEGPNGEMDWAMMEDEETWKDLRKKCMLWRTPTHIHTDLTSSTFVTYGTC